MTAEESLAIAFLELHPARAAKSLEQMPVAGAAEVLRHVPVAIAAPVLREMAAPNASEYLGALPARAGAAIVAEFAIDDAAVVVRAMQADQRDSLLAALSADQREPIVGMLRYPDGTAGAVMDPAVFQLPDDVIVADARLRLLRARRELLYYLYVVDRGNHLVGVLDIPELMLAGARDPVSATMHREVDRLAVGMPVSLVREHPGWQRYHAMPVVDGDGRLLGAIRYQTLRRLERDASDRGPDPALLTAGALAEIFHLGTTGVVAGLAATAPGARDAGRPVEAESEVPDAG